MPMSVGDIKCKLIDLEHDINMINVKLILLRIQHGDDVADRSYLVMDRRVLVEERDRLHDDLRDIGRKLS